MATVISTKKLNGDVTGAYTAMLLVKFRELVLATTTPTKRPGFKI